MSNTEELPLHLRGNWTPVQEQRTITDLEVRGTIPAELDGRYVRNGANPVTGFSDHPFLGDGMIHGIRLREAGPSGIAIATCRRRSCPTRTSR